jgi:hypothetical protein
MSKTGGGMAVLRKIEGDAKTNVDYFANGNSVEESINTVINFYEKNWFKKHGT